MPSRVVDLRVAAAHVDRGLADLADALRGRDHAREVVVVREVLGLADRRPDAPGARSKIAEPAAKPSAGSSTAAVAMPHRRRATVSVMNRRRVTVSPSKAPGMLRSSVYLDLGCLRDSGKGRWNCYRSDGSRTARTRRSGAAPPSLGGLVVRCRTARDGRRSGVPDGVRAGRIALGVRLRAQRDHVGQLGHRLEVADRREPLEAERVQAVAGQQRQVRIVRLARRARRRSAAGSPRGSPPPAAGRPRRAPATASPCGCGAGAVGRRRSTASRPPSARSASARRSSALTTPPRTPRRPPRPCARCARRCARWTGTRPRTARRADRRRGRAARGTRRRRPRCRRRRRRRSPSGGSAAKKTVSRPVVEVTDTGRSPAASRSPSASARVVSLRRQVGLLVQQRERRAAGGDRERVPAQRAGLVDVAGGRDPLHQRRASRRTPRPAARRRGSCPSRSGPAARRSAPARRPGRRGSR